MSLTDPLPARIETVDEAEVLYTVIKALLPLTLHHRARVLNAAVRATTHESH